MRIRSIKGQFLVSLSSIFVIFLVCVMLISYSISNKIVRKQSVEKIQADAIRCSSKMNSYLEQYGSRLHEINESISILKLSDEKIKEYLSERLSLMNEQVTDCYIAYEDKKLITGGD